MARALGLGDDTGPNSSLMRSLGRLLMFGLVRVEGRRLEVRAVIPPLPAKQCQRLPVHLQQAHTQWSDSEPHLALTLGFTGGLPQSMGVLPANDLALRLGEVQRQIDEQSCAETSCTP